MTMQFPIQVSVFGRDTIKLCSQALDDALNTLSVDGADVALTDGDLRQTLATGIVVAATRGVRDRLRLQLAALAHLDRTTAHQLPSLELVPGENGHDDANRYRLRAEELRAAYDHTADPACRDLLVAVTRDYERMATTAERIAASRRTLARLANNGTLSTIKA